MSDALVEIGRYLDHQEAEVVKALLVGCGIRAEVFGDNQGNMIPYQGMVAPTRVLVPARSFAEAQAILADRTPPPAEAGEVDDAPPLGVESKTLVRRAFVAALFGAFFAPVLAQLYSLYLAKAAFARWPELDRWDKRKLVFAVAFDLVVVGTAAAILWKIKT